MDQEKRGAGRFSECHFGASTKKRMTSSKKKKKSSARRVIEDQDVSQLWWRKRLTVETTWNTNRLEFVTEREILIVWVVSIIGMLGCRWSRMFSRRGRGMGRSRGSNYGSSGCNYGSGGRVFIWDDGGRRGWFIRANCDSDTACRNSRYLYRSRSAENLLKKLSGKEYRFRIVEGSMLRTEDLGFSVCTGTRRYW